MRATRKDPELESLARDNPETETIYLRLGLEPMCWDSNPAKTHGLPTEIIDLVLGPNEAQVLDVSSQKEFSERQSDR